MPVVLNIPYEAETWMAAQWPDASKLQHPLPDAALRVSNLTEATTPSQARTSLLSTQHSRSGSLTRCPEADIERATAQRRKLADTVEKSDGVLWGAQCGSGRRTVFPLHVMHRGQGSRLFYAGANCGGG